jgi:hypothetical protein
VLQKEDNVNEEREGERGREREREKIERRRERMDLLEKLNKRGRDSAAIILTRRNETKGKARKEREGRG